MSPDSSTIALFGEVMLRLAPEGKYRFPQILPGSLEAQFGGSEANACASIAMMGKKTRFLTALPDNPIAQSFINQMRSVGVDTERILVSPTGRMGIYFVEHGSGPRGLNVIYDRAYSTISLLPPEAYDFSAMLDGVCLLHLSGITPALSENAFRTTLKLAETAHEAGIPISIDLNYRKKLWNWKTDCTKNELACRCMTPITALADIVTGSDDEIYDMFDPENTHVAPAPDASLADKGLAAARFLSEKFPGIRIIAVPLLENVSADYNIWSAMLYDTATGKTHFAPLDSDGQPTRYEVRNIVDRLGVGDAFCAGLLLALTTQELATPEKAVRYATAAACLKFTIHGDINYVSRKDVDTLMNGSVTGQVQR